VRIADGLADAAELAGGENEFTTEMRRYGDTETHGGAGGIAVGLEGELLKREEIWRRPPRKRAPLSGRG